MKITKKELQILRLISKGFSDFEIAKKLNNSKRTINSHRRSLLLKTQSKNMAQMIAITMRLKILK